MVSDRGAARAAVRAARPPARRWGVLVMVMSCSQRVNKIGSLHHNGPPRAARPLHAPIVRSMRLINHKPVFN